MFTGIAGPCGRDGLAVKAGVHTHQNRLGGEARGPGQDPVQGLIGSLGAVLGSFAQFHADVPTLLAQVSGDGGIADKPRVGPTDTFLPGVGVIESEHVQVERYIATGQWGDRYPSPLQQPCQRRSTMGRRTSP